MSRLWITRLREILDTKGRSVADLARESGISYRTLAKYLAGEIDATHDQISKIAKALETPVWHFYVTDPSDIARLRAETAEARKRFEPEKQKAYDEALRQLTLLAEEHDADLLEAFAQDIRRQRALLKLAASRAAAKPKGD